MNPVVALEHLRALCPTLLQRPHLLRMDAIKAVATSSNFDEFLASMMQIVDSFGSIQMTFHAVAEILVQLAVAEVAYTWPIVLN